MIDSLLFLFFSLLYRISLSVLSLSLLLSLRWSERDRGTDDVINIFVLFLKTGRSRAVASVNHLEIPAELAFVLSKLDNWEPVNTEKSLAKVSGQVI